MAGSKDRRPGSVCPGFFTAGADEIATRELATMRQLSPKHVSSMFAHWSAVRIIDLMLILLGLLKRKLESSSRVNSAKERV